MMPLPPRPAAGQPRQVVIFAVPDGLMLDVAGPADVFAASAAAGGPAYAITLATPQGGPLRLSNGLSVHSTQLAAAPLDDAILILAGGAGARRAAGDAALARSLAQAGGRARLVASVCTGTFLLAAAGLGQGLRVTTHWFHAAALRKLHPGMTVDPDPIYIQQGRIWTSAGVTAGIDMALAILEQEAGRDIALTVARHLVMFLRRPGGQSQFAAPLAAQSRERAGATARFDALHAHIAANLAGDLRVEALAAIAGIAPRSFARHYLARTGQTPARAVAEMRLSAARALIESGVALADAAQRTGFGDASAMRRAFGRSLRIPPSAYAARFTARGRSAGKGSGDFASDFAANAGEQRAQRVAEAAEDTHQHQPQN